MEPLSDRTTRTLLAWLAVLAAAVAFWRLPGMWGTIQDDGFIYFRIAENAARGLGPVFNPGDRVDAATSPVWVWLLALVSRLGAPLPLAAPCLGLLFATATIVLVGRWTLELAAPRSRAGIALALIAPLLLVADPRFLFYAVSGMEAPLAALTWTWAARSLVRQLLQGAKEPRTGWAVLLACLVRPEFVLVAASIVAVALVKRRATLRALARLLAPAAIGGVAYLGLHWAWFGDPLPNTWWAKRAGDWTHVRIGLAYLAALPRTYPWLFAGFLALAVPRLRLVAVALGLGFVVDSIQIVRLGGDHFVFYRPYVLWLPLLLPLAGAAATYLWNTRPMPLRVVTAALAVAALGTAIGTRIQPGSFAWVRVATQLGYALARDYPKDTRVGMFAIGATGWASRLPVVDALGLADRHVARQDAFSHQHACALDIGHERGDPAYVLEHSDVVVPFGAYAPIQYESLDEVREGFYSQKQFIAVAREAIREGRFRLHNITVAPGTYWLVLEKVR